METYLILVVFGLLIGLLGTLIGAGGGFILTPALLLLYPSESPEIRGKMIIRILAFALFLVAVRLAFLYFHI